MPKVTRGGNAQDQYNTDKNTKYSFFDDLKTSNAIKNNKEFVIDGDGVLTIPNDANVYAFSDLEGCIPDGIMSVIEKAASNSKSCIVYTGDLIDRGHESLRMLKAFVKLKEHMGNRLVLICGNRDINKIRVANECWIDNVATAFRATFSENQSFAYVLEYIKSYNFNSLNFNKIASHIGSTLPARGVMSKDHVTNTFVNNVNRISNIYSSTLGAGLYPKLFIDELCEIYPECSIELQKLEKERQLLLLAVFNMIMGFDWKGDTNLGILNEYKGLYLNYLERCDIIRVIRRDKTVYVASHSGIPFVARDNKFVIPQEIGKLPNDSVSYFGKELNQDFTTFIKNFKSVETGLGRNDALNTAYKKYIAMSAKCGIIENHVTHEIHMHEMSPIVAYTDIMTRGPFTFWKGGYGINLFGSAEKVFNIFGHQPVGYVPEITKVEKDGVTTYHACLDISKCEDVNLTNKVAYAYLELGQDGGMVHGNVTKKGLPSLEYNINLDDYVAFEVDPQYERPLFKINDHYMGQYVFEKLDYSKLPAKLQTTTTGGAKNKKYKKGSYESMTVVELRERCAKRKIKFSGLKKAELIKALRK